MAAVPERPYSDAFLLTFSEEHLAYEVEMLTWLVNVFGGSAALPTPPPGSALNNVLLESFALHFRNVTDSLSARIG